MLIDVAKTYPETKQYNLVNTFSGDSFRVTDNMLKMRFAKEDLQKIYSGRHKVFFLEDILD